MDGHIKQIDVQAAKERLDAGDAVFVDIRDPGSFAESHIAGATHLSDANAESFIAETAKEKTVIVYCYHGHSSLMGANFLVRSGFQDVYSMSGGFEVWRTEFETDA